MAKAGKTKNQLADQTAAGLASDRRCHQFLDYQGSGFEVDCERLHRSRCVWGEHTQAATSAELFDVTLKQSFGAIRTEAVREVSFRVLVDIGF